MTESTHDPGATPQEEGLPETVDDNYPERALVDDPEIPPVPTREPTVSTDVGTTAEEQAAGQTMDERLAREEADPAAAADPAGGPLDIDAPDAAEAPETE